MIEISVGKPLEEGRTWRPGYWYWWNGGHCVNVILDQSEVETYTEHKDKPMKVGFVVEEGIVFFLAKLEWEFGYSDCPIYAKVLGDTRPVGNETALTVIAMTAPEGIVVGIRMIGMPTDFSRRMGKALREAEVFDENEYGDRVAKVYAKYINGEQLAERGFICKVGDK